MHIIIARWTEPCNGSVAWTCDLTPAEAQRVGRIIKWLEEHAGDDYGHTLAEWELHGSSSKGTADIPSLDAMLNCIALNSRYNELDTPGEFYGATNADLDGLDGRRDRTMLNFLKLDLVDEDEPIQTTVQAESLEALLAAEVSEYQQDDRLSPCHGFQTAECVSHDDDSIQWSPGDGGSYTIAFYAPDTPEGAALIESWFEQ